MKIKGQEVNLVPNIVDVFIPRGEGGILFKCQPVRTMDKFSEKFPEPVPKMRHRPGKPSVPNLEDENYKSAMEAHNATRYAYFILESLKATEDLEWELVNEDDPTTWVNYMQELEASGFLPTEINMIINGVMKANSLDEEHLRAQRERFLAGTLEAEVL